MTKLELLYAQKSEKFGELCAVAARELGYGAVLARRESTNFTRRLPLMDVNRWKIWHDCFFHKPLHTQICKPLLVTWSNLLADMLLTARE